MGADATADSAQIADLASRVGVSTSLASPAVSEQRSLAAVPEHPSDAPSNEAVQSSNLQKLSPQVPQASAEHCPSCGTQILIDSHFCSKCDVKKRCFLQSPTAASPTAAGRQFS